MRSVVLILLVCGLAVGPAASAFADDIGPLMEDGFRGWSWGTSFKVMDSVFQLTPAKSGPSGSTFRVSLDSLCGREVDLCSVSFCKDEKGRCFLCAYSVVFARGERREELKDALVSVLGEPRPRTDAPLACDALEWNDSGTLRRIAYDSGTGRVIVCATSLESCEFDLYGSVVNRLREEEAKREESHDLASSGR